MLFVDGTVGDEAIPAKIDESVLPESKADLMEKLRLTNAGYYTNAAMPFLQKRAGYGRITTP